MAEDVAAFQNLVKDRLSSLRNALLSDNVEGRERLEAQVAKLESVKTKLSEWTEGISSDDELQSKASELMQETKGLLGDLSCHPGAQRLLEQAKRVWSDEERSKELLGKLQEKLLANKEIVQELLVRAPSLMEGLSDSIGGDDREMAVKDWLERMQEKSGGKVKLHEEKALQALLEDHGAALLPLLKEKAGDLVGKLKEIRQEKQGQEFLAKGLDYLSQRDIQEKLALENAPSAEQVLDWGERMVKDAQARREMIDRVKDIVLDFLISYLPDVSIPPIEGDKEGLLYNIENLDMSGFKIRKENVSVSLNGFEEIEQGAPFFVISVDQVAATLKDISWRFKQDYFPNLSGSGAADAWVTNGSVEIGLQLVKVPRESSNQESESPAADSNWRPKLLLANCEVDIQVIDVSVKGSQLSWLYNTISELFSESLRLYIISLLQDTMMEHFSSLSEKLDEFISNKWPLIGSFLDVDISQLPEACVAQDFVAKARLAKLASKRRDVYSVTFEQPGQLGLVFSQLHEFVVVKEFRRTPDNQKLPAERGGQVRLGDILVAFNGQQVTSLPLGRVMEKLRRAGRPLHLTFMVPSETQRARSAVAGSSTARPIASTPSAHGGAKAEPSANAETAGPVVDLEFNEKRLYLVMLSRWPEELDKADEDEFAAIVKGFRKKEDGTPGPVEALGVVKCGMILVGVNGKSLKGLSFNDVHAVLRDAHARPLKLRFCEDTVYDVRFTETGPTDMRLSPFGLDKAVVKSFVPIKGQGEEQCEAFLQQGDVVWSINDEPVASGEFVDTVNKLKSLPRPIKVGFRRLGEDKDVGHAVFESGPLGIIFYRSPENNVAFKAYSTFPGPAKTDGKIAVGHVLLSINSQQVPRSEEEIYALLNGPLPVELRLRDMFLQEYAVKGLVS